MKTYVWLAPEKLKFINDNPQVVSLLYDLGLLPEEISARVRGYVEEETAKLNLQNRALWHVLGELTVQDSQGDWYVSIKEGFRINGLVGDLMESRVTEKRKCEHDWIPSDSKDPVTCLKCGARQ